MTAILPIPTSSPPTRSWPTGISTRRAYREFCDTHLAGLDEVMVDYVESSDFDRLLVDTVRDAFPAHEHDAFIAHYRGLLGAWADDQRSSTSDPN